MDAVNRKIREALGARSLGAWPTPLEPAPELAAAVRVERLWVKREDRSAPLYGGNKVRSLEFLLARVASGDVLVTMGGTGSTHCLATAVHGAALGCRVVLAQFPQPPTDQARAIGDACRRAGAVLWRAPSRAAFPLTFARAWSDARRRGARRWISAGGAHPAGVLGHFLAGLELAEQLDEAAPPDAVVAPLGTGGTVAGLSLAMAQLRWPTSVVGVRVASRLVANRWRVIGLARRAWRLIAGLDASMNTPHSAFRTPHSFVIVNGLGPGYGHATVAGERARSVAAPHGLALDSTYSAKAFAALEGLVARGFRRIVFWHTFAAPTPDTTS